MSGQRGRRRALLFTCLLVVGLLLPAPAGAAKPIRFTDESTTLECFLVNDEGSLALWVSVGSEFDPDATIDFWPVGTSPENDDPPTFGRNFDLPVEGGGSPEGIDVEVAMIDIETGDPAGSAVVTATLEPVGDPQPFSGRDRFGNRHSRSEGVEQELVATGGSATFGGSAFALDNCVARTVTATIFESNPNTFVNRSSGLHLECFFELPEAFISLFADEDRFGAFAEMFIDPPPTFGGATEVEFSSSLFRAEFEFFDDSTGEPTGDTASAAATLAPNGPPEDVLLRRRNAVLRFTRQEYTVTGTLTIPSLDLELDMSTCAAVSEEEKFAGHSAAGPKAGTRLAANDVPEGAPILPSGRGIIRQTANSSLEPEVEASCLPVDPEFGLQFGRTLWYRVKGTGGELTLSTSRSNFDTALAVYAGEPGALEEIGCNDDLIGEHGQLSLQGPLTFETEAGETYWVQVGGYAGEYGQLRLSVR
jgi:hypothetical protein